MAVGPPQFLECARVKRHWSKAFHSRVARTGHHRVAAAVEDRYPKIAFVSYGKPIAIGPSHRIKSLHACSCKHLPVKPVLRHDRVYVGLSFNVTCCPNILVLLVWWLMTSGNLVDSRGAEKVVSQTRFTRTLRGETLCVKCRIYVVAALCTSSALQL